MRVLRTLSGLTPAILVLFLALASSLSVGGVRDDEHRRLAEEYVRRGNIPAAVRELDKIVQRTPDDYSWQGELLMRLGRPQFAGASVAFRKALDTDSRNVRALYGLGILAVIQKQYREAESLLRRVLEVQAGYLHAQNWLAGALMYQKKFTEAENILLALEREPAMGAIPTGNLGELYFHQGRLDLAEAKLKEAISRQPDNFDWHRWLAEVYRLRRQRRAAVIEYRKALELLERSQMADVELIEGIRAQIQELEKR